MVVYTKQYPRLLKLHFPEIIVYYYMHKYCCYCDLYGNINYELNACCVMMLYVCLCRYACYLNISSVYIIKVVHANGNGKKIKT